MRTLTDRLHTELGGRGDISTSNLLIRVLLNWELTDAIMRFRRSLSTPPLPLSIHEVTTRAQRIRDKYGDSTPQQYGVECLEPTTLLNIRITHPNPYAIYWEVDKANKKHGTNIQTGDAFDTSTSTRTDDDVGELCSATETRCENGTLTGPLTCKTQSVPFPDGRVEYQGEELAVEYQGEELAKKYPQECNEIQEIHKAETTKVNDAGIAEIGRAHV